MSPNRRSKFLIYIQLPSQICGLCSCSSPIYENHIYEIQVLFISAVREWPMQARVASTSPNAFNSSSADRWCEAMISASNEFGLDP